MAASSTPSRTSRPADQAINPSVTPSKLPVESASSQADDRQSDADAERDEIAATAPSITEVEAVRAEDAEQEPDEVGGRQAPMRAPSRRRPLAVRGRPCGAFWHRRGRTNIPSLTVPMGMVRRARFVRR